MIIFQPLAVRLGGERLEGVTAVAVERETTRLIEARGAGGPHTVFADAPECRTMVRLTQRLTETTLDELAPGALRPLEVDLAMGGLDGRARRLTAMVMVTEVSYALRGGAGAGGAGGAVRTCVMVAVSADGAADPVSIIDPAAGA